MHDSEPQQAGRAGNAHVAVFGRDGGPASSASMHEPSTRTSRRSCARISAVITAAPSRRGR